MSQSNVGDLNVRIGLDTADMDRAEKAVSSSTSAIERAMQGTADVVKKAFMGVAGAMVTSGVLTWLRGTERSLASFGDAMKQSAGQTATNLKNLATVAQGAGSAVSGSVGAMAFAMQHARTIMVGGLIGAAVIGAVSSFISTAQSAVVSMEQMSAAASRVGQSSSNFSRLEFAIASTGTSVDNFRAGMKSLTESLGKDDAFSPALRALQSLGIVSKDATQIGMSLDDVLRQVANKFQFLEDGANKTALALAIFGATGDSWIPALNRGGTEIDRLRELASRMGAEISGKVSADAQAYVANMAKAHEINKTIATQIGEAFLPAMKRASEAWVRFSEGAQLGNNIGGAFRAMLGGIYIAIQPVVGAFETLSVGIGNVVKAAMQVASGDLKGAYATLAGTGNDVAAVWSRVGDRIVKTADYIAPGITNAVKQATGLTTAFGSWEATVTKGAAPVIRSVEEVQGALAKTNAEAANALAELVKSRDIPLTEKLTQLKTMVDGQTISWQQYFSAVRSAKDLSKELSAEIGRMNAEFARMQLNDALGNSKLPIQEKIDMLSESVLAGTIRFHEFTAMMDRVRDQGTQAMDTLLSTTSTALTSIFKESKAAAIASAIINTYQGITKALATYGPTPQGIALSSLAAAMGFAQVQAIRNTNKGGSGGGSAAGAVSSSAPAASSPSARESGSDQSLFVRGIDPKQMFSGEVVRGLAQKLLDFQRDGGRVVLE